MSEVFIQFPFRECPLKRGNRTKFYDGLAKVQRTSEGFRGQAFTVRDAIPLDPGAAFYDEDFELIERFLEHKASAEILALLKAAEEAAGVCH